VALAHLLLPGTVRSDGTQSGEFEMTLRVVCGAVSALVYVSALAIGGGMFAREREDDLLAQTLVRPVSAFCVAYGRWLAVLLLLSCVVSVNVVFLNVASFLSGYRPPDCKIHIAPSLPAVEVSAARAMKAFLADEKTPEAVKKSSRAAVLSLLISPGR
jgi:ABC-type Na+ efflux pump permease subunit